METPEQVVQQLHPILTHYLAWFKAHERLVLLLAIGFLGTHFYVKYFDYRVKQDQTAAQIANQKVKVDDTSVQQLQKQLIDSQKTFAANLVSLQTQINQRDQQNQKQKNADQNMNDAQLAAHWAAIINVKPEEVTASQLPDHLEVSSNAAHVSVNTIEDAQTCKLDLNNTQVLLGESQKLTQDTQTTLTATRTELFDEKGAHAKDVKELKDKNRTAWLHGFKWGVGVSVTVVEAFRILVLHKP